MKWLLDSLTSKLNKIKEQISLLVLKLTAHTHTHTLKNLKKTLSNKEEQEGKKEGEEGGWSF